MTSFDRREEAIEAKFAHDEENAFKARARALRMLGLWAAERRGETGKAAEEYAHALIEADIAADPYLSNGARLIWQVEATGRLQRRRTLKIRGGDRRSL